MWRWALFINLLFLSIPSTQAQGTLDLAGITFKARYQDQMIFRGRTFSTEPVYQGEFGFGLGRFNYKVSYTEPTEDLPFEQGVITFDRELTHDISFTTLSMGGITTMGYLFYDYQGDGQPDTQELYVRYAQNNPWNPSFGIAFDFDTYKGYYADASLARSIPISRRLSTTFGLLAGFAYELEEKTVRESLEVLEQGFYGKDGWTHGEAFIRLNYKFSKWLEAQSGMHYHHAADDFLIENELLDENEWAWKTTLTLYLK
jgi:hypothetical protein